MKFTKHLKNNNGITLVELLVAISLIGIVLGGSVMIALMGLNTFKLDINQSDVQYEVRRASAEINEKLRNATNISSNVITTSIPPILLANELKTVDAYDCHYTVNENVLQLDLYAKKGNTEFELSTDILLNNSPLGLIDAYDVDLIYYTLPDIDIEPYFVD
jgi:type II secretory pathway pseudopilin PulG